MSNKPVKRIRIGYVEASVWANDTQNGSFYSVTLSRTYREGDEYKSTSSLGHGDLLNAAKCLEVAGDWISSQ